MANLLPIQYFQLPNGQPAVGGTLTAYATGGTYTTLKAIYTDNTGTVAMSNPTSGFTSNGMISGGIWGSGLYDLWAKDSAGNTIFKIPGCGNAADNTAVAGGGSAVSTPLVPSTNRIINSNFRLGPNNQLTYSGQTLASGAICAENWYVLTQTGTITAAINTASPITNTPTSLTITQSQSTAQGLGIIQVIPSEATYAMRGQTIQASMSINSTAGLTAYMAILSVTSSNDAPVINVVNSWTNPTYTSGNFFTSAASPISAVNSTILTANSPTAITTSGTVPQTATNLLLFVYFTGGSVLNTTVIDFSQAALYESSTALNVRPVHNFDEIARLNTRVKLGSYSASASANLTQYNLTGDFRYIEIVLTDFINATDDKPLCFQYSFNNTSLDTSSNYQSAYGTQLANGTASSNGGSGALSGTYFTLDDNVGGTANRGVSGIIRLYNPAGTSLFPRITYEVMRMDNSGNIRYTHGGGVWTSAASAVQGFGVFFNASNITSGTMEVYGHLA